MLILEPDGRITSYGQPQSSIATALGTLLMRVVRRCMELVAPQRHHAIVAFARRNNQ